jgi:hypothetical protein
MKKNCLWLVFLVLFFACDYPKKPFLKISTTLDCQLTIDGKEMGMLKAGEENIKKFPLDIGEYKIVLKAENVRDRIERVVIMERKDKVLNIDLKTVSERRIAIEREYDLTEKSDANEVNEKWIQIMEDEKISKLLNGNYMIIEDGDNKRLFEFNEDKTCNLIILKNEGKGKIAFVSDANWKVKYQTIYFTLYRDKSTVESDLKIAFIDVASIEMDYLFDKDEGKFSEVTFTGKIIEINSDKIVISGLFDNNETTTLKKISISEFSNEIEDIENNFRDNSSESRSDRLNMDETEEYEEVEESKDVHICTAMKSRECCKAVVISSDPDNGWCPRADGEGRHQWYNCGKAGNRNFQCRSCGIVVRTKNQPRNSGCCSGEGGCGGHHWDEIE